MPSDHLPAHRGEGLDAAHVEPWRHALAEEFASAGLASELRWSLEWLEDCDAEPTAPPA